MPKLIIVKSISNKISIDQCLDKYIDQYLESLSEAEKQAYMIAKDHLESSFNLEKSIGFIQFKKNLESLN